jgi:hypothetical protein
MIDIVTALQSIRPQAGWAIRGDELEWLDTEQTQPTQSEIDAEVIRLQAEYDAQEYARNRKADYPNIAEQLDMLYWDSVNGTSIWQEAINAVKAKYPKGDS